MKAHFEKIFKPEVRKIQPYTLPKFAAEVKLDQNENPHGFPPALKAAFWARLQEKDWARYPAYDATSVRATLAQKLSLPKEQLLVANGSNALIQSLLMVIISSGDSIIIPQPTFSLYKTTVQLLSGQAAEVMLNPTDFSLPVEHVLEQAHRLRAKAVILCSPNNPTGVAYSRDQIVDILENFDGLVVVDEAYVEFSDQDLLPLLQPHDRLVLLRTLSKAYAMAGCRVGYMLAHPEIIREVSKAFVPYCISIFAEAAALVALDHQRELDEHILRLQQERERLYTTLQQLSGVTVFPSAANFFLLRFECEAREVFDGLLEQKILVRDVSHYPMLENCLRVSVGSPAENQRFLAALKPWSGAIVS